MNTNKAKTVDFAAGRTVVMKAEVDAHENGQRFAGKLILEMGGRRTAVLATRKLDQNLSHFKRVFWSAVFNAATAVVAAPVVARNAALNVPADSTAALKRAFPDAYSASELHLDKPHRIHGVCLSVGTNEGEGEDAEWIHVHTGSDGVQRWFLGAINGDGPTRVVLEGKGRTVAEVQAAVVRIWEDRQNSAE